MSATFTRRVALIGAAASTAALAVPAIAAAHVAEHPNDKVRRLAKEIAAALRDPAFLGFQRVTITPNGLLYDDAEEVADDRERAQFHATRMAEAIQRVKGGHWRLTCHDDTSVLFMINHPEKPPGLFVQNFGGTIGRDGGRRA